MNHVNHVNHAECKLCSKVVLDFNLSKCDVIHSS